MPLSAGQRLGPYEILAPLGAGGMGEVYRARDTRLDRAVAIKVLPPATAGHDERRKRFFQEARTASALNHPNIVSLYDISADSGIEYLVMELVPGQSLDRLITPRGLGLAESLHYARQIASGLAAAHAAGVVHRDVKPGNVMVTPDSHVKILDFGLAKLVEPAPAFDEETRTQEPHLTKAGTVVGTAGYMSPEQASGKSTDYRTDIFSLGVVFYEMLSGKRPFRAQSTVEILHAIIHQPAAPLAQPPELQEIVEKAMAKDPGERYQHAGDFALDLRRFQKAWESRSLPSLRGPSNLAPGPRWILVCAAAAGVALAAAAGWFWGSGRAPLENPLDRAAFSRLTDFDGSEYDAAISRDGRFVVFRSDREGPADTWVTQVGSGHFVNLTRASQPNVLVRNAGFTPDGSEIWLAGVIGGARLRLLPSMGGTPRHFLPEGAINVAWTRDGSELVFHAFTPGDPMYVADRTGANPRQIFTLKPGGHNHYPVWSPDKKWIYFISGIWDAREMDIWRIRPFGGAPERVTNQNADLHHLAWLDERTLLYVSPDQNGAGPWLWAHDVSGGTTRRISSELGIYTSVDVSSDGRRIVTTTANPTANLWAFPISGVVASEQDAKPFNVPSVRAYAPRFGGSSLFYLSSHGGGDGLWRYDGQRAIEVWRGADGALFEPAAVAAEGLRVAIIVRKQGKRTLHVLSADGGDAHSVASSIDVTSAVSWSPDGKWLVAGGVDAQQHTGLFKISADGGDVQRIVDGVAINPLWSPDGSVIAYTGPTVGITGPLRMVRPDGTPVDAPAIPVRVGTEHYRFIPGGRELVYVPTTSQVVKETFWLLDLVTKKTRQLADFDCRATRTFDITPDGKQVVFDRLRENSDIVLIELPEKAGSAK